MGNRADENGAPPADRVTTPPSAACPLKNPALALVCLERMLSPFDNFLSYYCRWGMFASACPTPFARCAGIASATINCPVVFVGSAKFRSLARPRRWAPPTAHRANAPTTRPPRRPGSLTRAEAGGRQHSSAGATRARRRSKLGVQNSEMLNLIFCTPQLFPFSEKQFQNSYVWPMCARRGMRARAGH